MEKNKYESYWFIIRSAISDFLRSESSPDGKLNLIFGLFIFVLIFLLCVPTTLQLIITFLKPSFKTPMPWYGVIIMFSGGIFYYYKCVKSLTDINIKKELLNK